MAFTGDDPPGGGKPKYFFLWTLTEEGRRRPTEVLRAIKQASAMVAASPGGECHLYVSVGGPYDMIGVLSGVDERRAIEIKQAIDALGMMETAFANTREFYLNAYQAHISRVAELVAVKLGDRPSRRAAGHGRRGRASGSA
jgi:uncharacterized protein with GYD domain